MVLGKKRQADVFVLKVFNRVLLSRIHLVTQLSKYALRVELHFPLGVHPNKTGCRRSNAARQLKGLTSEKQAFISGPACAKERTSLFQVGSS